MITYRRRQQYFAENGDVWDAEYTDLYDEYAPVLGKATCQQLARKNSEAWRSHFSLLETYHDASDTRVTEKPAPPGYWGTREDGYQLHGLVRNDLYSFDWEETTSTLDSENTTQSAAIDVGTNNTLAIVTDTGERAVYHARPEFERFQEYTERIATLQSALPDEQCTSQLIQRLYDQRSRTRDHSRDGAIKHAAEWLLARNVDTVYVGELTDVLETHWPADVNEKTHAF
ncbi:IS1341-type transposase [Halalkaliarchaeum desulfuricum]|uniref:IS1341-type transposase n=1 Tax=Halalkaliarchaeum desulfuricum TaxID=2055893 RepID=A0A343TMX1_9EURY|nr:transposase [Halalkaliarchaeum desulfuricum]AUX10443.1 IS1341-type transposase [Halalkaliarchaeum desulfuricum]